MENIAFKMKLYSGYSEEYKRRHGVIWPELMKLLKDAGVTDYSIFLDEETNIVFASLKAVDITWLNELAATDIMKEWWAYMADIMESHADNSPVIVPLKEIFYMQ